MVQINQPRTKAHLAPTRPQVGRSPRKKARQAGLVLVREELVAEWQEVLAWTLDLVCPLQATFRPCRETWAAQVAAWVWAEEALEWGWA